MKNRATWVVLSALVLLGSSGVAFGQTRATISGVVVGPGGAPQPNVPLVITNAAGIDRRAVSETDGAYVFGGLQPGTYRLRTDDETFAPFSQDQIVLVAGQTATIRVALQPRVPVEPAVRRATVAGTVIGPEGKPLANVTVIITNPAGIDRRAVSDTNGAYVFGGLQPGAYRLRVEDPGPGAKPFALVDLAFVAGEQRQFDIRLQPVPPPPPPPPTSRAPAAEPAAAAAGAPRGDVDVQTRVADAVPQVSFPGEEFEAMPDRWQFQWPRFERYEPAEKMPWIVGSAFDPYNQYTAKADRPIGGSGSLFANVNLQSNTTFNPRRVGQNQIFYTNNFVAGLELFRGDTVFQPKSWAVRGTIVGNLNGTSDAGKTNNRRTYGLEEAFVEKRLAVLSPAFDFMSVRGGVQNFNSDFRGYLFVDNQLGVRLFGNAGSNRYQYNVAYFSMRNREVFSQLHELTSRNQDVFIANYFIQDLGAEGYTGMFNLHVNRDKGTPNDPNALLVTYAGFHGDGTWGSWAVSHAFYQAFGKDDDNSIARGLRGGPSPSPVDINARMAAFELSRDADWRRYRFSIFYASGDDRSDPGKARGFDMITDNPNLAGGPFMFWTQQAIAVPGLQLVSEKFSLLPNLRGKFVNRREEGDIGPFRSNFVNPGLILLNGGVDLRVSPQLKVATNASYVRFADATVLRQLLRGRPGFEDETIGWDIGATAKYRPFINENLFVVLGFTTLIPQGGFATAFGEPTRRLFSFVSALQVAY